MKGRNKVNEAIKTFGKDINSRQGEIKSVGIVAFGDDEEMHFSTLATNIQMKGGDMIALAFSFLACAVSDHRLEAPIMELLKEACEIRDSGEHSAKEAMELIIGQTRVAMEKP